MAGPDIDDLGLFLLGAKPPKSLGEFLIRLLIAVIIFGVLLLIGRAMLLSFIEGF